MYLTQTDQIYTIKCTQEVRLNRELCINIHANGETTKNKSLITRTCAGRKDFVEKRFEGFLKVLSQKRIKKRKTENSKDHT